MPLPPLPANNTDRAWLSYTFGGKKHDICFRVPAATTQATVITMATALANALKPSIPSSDSFTGLKHQDSGSILTFPLAFTPIGGTGSVSPNDTDKAQFVALSGRSLGGYRCRITFFTHNWGETTDFRLPTSTAGAPTQLYSAVTGMTPQLVAIDGQDVIWNGYVNVGYNAYWQRQLRA